MIIRPAISAAAKTRIGRETVDFLRPFYHRFNPWTGLAGLDKRLVAHLQNEPGYFIEAGANDGLRQSNTFYLEARRGWRGLLIEPIPRLAARCRRNRPNAVVVNAALVAPENQGKSIAMQDVDLMSIVQHARGSTGADEAHVKLAESIQGIHRRSTIVQGRTLSDVIDESSLPRIDLLSLDVEGYEKDVLRGLDLARHAPRWILVETAQPERIAELLGEHYETVTRLSHHDWLFVRPG